MTEYATNSETTCPALRWLCATDSFKGTLSATAASSALARGISRELPGAQVQVLPMADGGEGTMAVLSQALGGSFRSMAVTAPLPGAERRRARWLEGVQGFSVVEFAEGAGLGLVELSARAPGRICSAAVGQLITSAIDAGAREILVGAGGSATVDGGIGVLQALGARVRCDSGWVDSLLGGADLAAVREVDLAPVRARLHGVRLRVAVDVDNPLLGARGAAEVFAPQKGATPADVLSLAAGLRQFSDVLAEAVGCESNQRSCPGDGAAGGAAFGLRLGAGASLESGARCISQLIGLQDALRGADRVVTGEGCYDDQTAAGKVAWEVARVAAGMAVPVAMVAGRIARSTAACDADPFQWHMALESMGDVACDTGDLHEARLEVAGAKLARN